MFRSKKDSGAPLEYRVTSRSAAQGVPCHAEQEECEAHIPQMETELEDQEENIQGVDQLLQVVDRYLNIQELTPEILHESWSASWCMSVPKGGRKKDWSISILTASATWSKNAEGAPQDTPFC